MSASRREFIRRMVVASGLMAAGLLSAWELVQKSAQGGTGAVTNPPTLPTPPAATTSDQTVTSLQTVTVTEYASGSSGSSAQQSATSSRSSQSSSQTVQAVPAGYVLVAPMSALSGKTSAYFNHPSRGLSLLVDFSGQWRAFSATCTHAPCTVDFSGSAIVCPCHGGTYNPTNGAVTGGPPPAPLPEMTVLIQNGNLYVAA